MITRGFAASQLSSRCYIRHARVACTPLHVTSGVSISTASNRMQAWEMSDFWHCNHYSMFSIDPLPQLNPYWQNMVFHVKHQTPLNVEDYTSFVYFVRYVKYVSRETYRTKIQNANIERGIEREYRIWSVERGGWTWIVCFTWNIIAMKIDVC